MARPQSDTPLVYRERTFFEGALWIEGLIGLLLFGCEVLPIILGIGKEGLDDLDIH
jgi:hypothetical protein